MKENEVINNAEPGIQNGPGGKKEKHEFPAPIDEGQQAEDLKKTALMWEVIKKNKEAGTEAFYYAWHMELLTKMKMGYTAPLPDAVKEYRQKNGLNEWGGDPSEAEGYKVDSQKLTPKEKEYQVHTFNHVDLKKNADNIKRTYDLLDSKDHWYKGGSSPRFRALMKELKTLKQLAAEMESNREKLIYESNPENLRMLRKQEKETLLAYLRASKEFDECAKDYLDHKKDNITSTYAKERFDAVTEARRICAINRDSVENTYRSEAVKNIERKNAPKKAEAYVKSEKEKYIDWMKNVYNKYSFALGQKKNREVYYGDRYTDADVSNLHSPYGLSIGRTAAHSMTTIALMAKKDEKTGQYLYSVEDIMDPSKLQKEKQEMFHEVVQKSLKEDPGNAKWLAETMHTGYMAAMKRTGETLRNVNFQDPDYIFHPDFSKAAMLSVNLMDVWQEMGREKMKDAMFEAAKKDFPNLKNTEEYIDITGTMRGYLDQFSVNIQRIAEGIRDLDGKYADNAMRNVFCNGLVVHNLKELFAKKATECRDKPFQEWFNFEEGAIGRAFMLDAFDHFAVFQFETKEDFEYKLPDILDGKMFANITYKFDMNSPKKFQYFGDFDQKLIHEDYEFSQLSEMEVLKRLNTQIDHLEELKKTSTPVMQQYLSNAIRGITTLSQSYGTGGKLSEAEKQAAKQAVKDIFSYQMAALFKRYDAKDDELQELIDRNLEKVPAYKKCLDYVGVGALQGLMTGDITDQIERCEEVYLAECRLVKRKLENGDYKKPENVELAYAMAYTVTLYDQVGRLPEKSCLEVCRYSPREYTNAYLKSWRKQENQEDQLRTLIEHPERIKDMLSDTEGMKKFVDRADEKARTWRAKEEERQRLEAEKRARDYERRRQERERKKLLEKKRAEEKLLQQADAKQEPGQAGPKKEAAPKKDHAKKPEPKKEELKDQILKDKEMKQPKKETGEQKGINTKPPGKKTGLGGKRK